MNLSTFETRLKGIISENTLEDAYALIQIVFDKLELQDYTLDYSETAPSLQVQVELPEGKINITA